MRVLGIETSCDETAAAVVDGEGRMLSNLVRSQLDDHRPFGGVVPEIAARAHLDHLDALVDRALGEADVPVHALDGVAATAGPGLIGGLFVGVMTGKALASARGLPFLAVNHLEGHALTPRLTDALAFPYPLLLVSGGHCQLLAVHGVGRYTVYGGTMDDAVGEAFDKVAKLLGLGHPGGPAVERAAREGDPARVALPRPMLGKPGCEMSFSGLKTAVRHAAGEAVPADLAAAFQAAVADVLADRCERALARFRAEHGTSRPLVVAGGVAANAALRARLAGVAGAHGTHLLAPPPGLCTDNAAMIAWAGLERLARGETHGLDARARPRWPLGHDEVSLDQAGRTIMPVQESGSA